MLECPFCDYRSADAYTITLHVETNHSDSGESPFATRNEESLALALTLQHAEERYMPHDTAKLSDGPRAIALSLRCTTGSTELEQQAERAAVGTEIDKAVNDYVECPHTGCGEHVYLIDFNDHLDIHASLDSPFASHTIAETAKSDTGHEGDPGHSSRSRRPSKSSIITSISSQTHTINESTARSSSVRSVISSEDRMQRTPGHGGGTQIGRKDLGPYAHEKHMPRWMYDELRYGAPIRKVNKIGKDGRIVRESLVENEVPGLVSVLAELSYVSRTVERAYLCHPQVQHVHNRQGHTGFCGYLNVQMQIAYIQGARAVGHEKFKKRIPSILKIQDLIENAWDQGIDTFGRQDTGGIRGTRKWIGTTEVSVLYQGLGIPHQINEYLSDRKKEEEKQTNNKQKAYERVLDFVESYFQEHCTKTGRITITNRAPLYLQQPGHSLTIIGLERRKDGSRNLLVFDPGFAPSNTILGFIGKQNIHQRLSGRDIDMLMRVYRRGDRELQKYDCLQTITLTSLVPSSV
ncbi:hypothetical protein AAFC00_002933 [Neodothiora populina]|uniref:C2H2-type domain-containing protein n=1 Tax=Neodothiora populina TaxID=2781224 RepID=A0ABR3P8Z1_9PEZI